jgi:hypothetical protein
LQGPIYWEIPPPPGGGEISANVIWGKKYEKGKRKAGNLNEKGERVKQRKKA